MFKLYLMGNHKGYEGTALTPYGTRTCQNGFMELAVSAPMLEIAMKWIEATFPNEFVSVCRVFGFNDKEKELCVVKIQKSA